VSAFSPEDVSTDIGELSFITEPSPEDYVYECIVSESCLDDLLLKFKTCKYLPTCDALVIRNEKSIAGTLLTVYTICELNHRCELWWSQLMIGNRSCGNLL
ncbi:Hypothetical predicted protein, partial [Pelobates cultripes]